MFVSILMHQTGSNKCHELGTTETEVPVEAQVCLHRASVDVVITVYPFAYNERVNRYPHKLSIYAGDLFRQKKR